MNEISEQQILISSISSFIHSRRLKIRWKKYEQIYLNNNRESILFLTYFQENVKFDHE